jgi:hypothetical protein
VLRNNQSLISIYLTLLLPLKFSLSPLSSSKPLSPSSFFKPLFSFLSSFSLFSLVASYTFILPITLALSAALTAALAVASSLYCLLTSESTLYLKALAYRHPNQDLRHLFTSIISALKQLRKSVIRYLAELNMCLHSALINSIANILRANWARSSYKR